MAAEIIPSGYDVKYGGEVEDIEQSFAELWNAMLIALLLIATILILQFNSFKTPLIILLTLPLMLIGVVIGMLVLHLPFSFSVFLGLISLAGIVVNDAIVLIDKTRRNIEEKNMYPKEAVVDAGDTRLQPILLTSITTIIGVAPLALSDEFWLGLSIAIIFGLAFATILQLFVIPMVFLQLEGKRLLKRRKQVNLN
jgi:multidrug efflux pump subunit AcrB